MSSFDYDMVIIGSGLDGSVAALRAAAWPLWVISGHTEKSAP
jgi:succinate dehydrogenase/fumarate reductase flavoprotein subunit